MDRGGVYYLVDGSKIPVSLRTKIKRHAEERLRQYEDGKFGLEPELTIGERYDTWIEEKRKVGRPSLARDYRQHFTRYLLDPLHGRSLKTLDVIFLKRFLGSLLGQG